MKRYDNAKEIAREASDWRNPVQPSVGIRNRLCRFTAGPLRTHEQQEEWREKKELPTVAEIVLGSAIAFISFVLVLSLAEWIAPRYIEDTPRPVSVEIEQRVG